MKLAIVGAGEQARELYSLIANSNNKKGEYKEIVMVDTDADEAPNIIAELDFFTLPVDEFEILVAMGEPTMRKKMFSKYSKMGYTFATFIHESAIVGSGTIIRPGVIILPFVYIAQETEIGRNTLLHAGVRIENNCVIGNNCFISSGTFIGAKTNVGNETFVGPNSTVKDQLTIGNNVIIGMGSNVVKNIDNSTVAVGNPSKKIRDNISGMVFI